MLGQFQSPAAAASERSPRTAWGGRPRARSTPSARPLACVGAMVPAASGTADAGPWYPAEGNGGYKVSHYDLDPSYDPTSGQLEAVTRIFARATQDLSRFNLDLQQLTVKRVTVNGGGVSFSRKGQELMIIPADGLRNGSRFVVTVTSGGVPKPLAGDTPYGFVPTNDGAATFSVEDGASTWFPCNDHPSDGVGGVAA
jgi:aminopeptidase N